MKFEVFVANLQPKNSPKIPNLHCATVKTKKDLKFVYSYLAKGAEMMGLKQDFDTEKRIESLIAVIEGYEDSSHIDSDEFAGSFNHDVSEFTKDWNLFVQNASNKLELLLERIRLYNLKNIGFYDRESLKSESKLQQISKLLSISYYMIINFADSNIDVALLNCEFMSIFASSMPSTWFSPQFINAIATLLDQLTKSRDNPVSILTLLKSHSLLKHSLGQNSIKVYSLLEKISQYAKPDINSIVIQILAQYAQFDIFAIPFFETQLYVKFDFNQQLSLAIAKVLVSLGDQKSIFSISQTLFQKQLDDFQILFLTKIYYYYATEKCKAYKFYSSYDTLFDEIEMNEASMFGLLGFIRAHQDSGYYNSKAVVKLLKGFECCKPTGKIFIAGEVVAGGKVSLGSVLSSKDFRSFLIEGVKTLFGSSLSLKLSRQPLDEKVSSPYFASLTRITNCLSTGIEAIIDDDIIGEIVEIIHNFTSSMPQDDSDDKNLLRYQKAVLYCIQTLLGPVSTYLTITKDTKIVLKIFEIMAKIKFITSKFPNAILDSQMAIYISIIKEMGADDLVKTIDQFGQPFKSDLAIELLECLEEKYLIQAAVDMESIDLRHRFYKRVADFGDKFPNLRKEVISHLKILVNTQEEKLPEMVGEIVLAFANFSFANRPVVDRWRSDSIAEAWECIKVIIDSYKSASVSEKSQLFKTLAYQISTVPFEKLDEFCGILENFVNDEANSLEFIYECISDPDSVDYSRRYKCVVWYLALRESVARREAAEKSLPIQAKL